jgi:uncharacterized coiled-coil DUF342 family protein
VTNNKHIDPLRAELSDIIQQINDHMSKLRDYSNVPENMWLARGELEELNRLLADLENQLDQIRAQDAENGY